MSPDFVGLAHGKPARLLLQRKEGSTRSGEDDGRAGPLPNARFPGGSARKLFMPGAIQGLASAVGAFTAAVEIVPAAACDWALSGAGASTVTLPPINTVIMVG